MVWDCREALNFDTRLAGGSEVEAAAAVVAKDGDGSVVDVAAGGKSETSTTKPVNAWKEIVLNYCWVSG